MSKIEMFWRWISDNSETLRQLKSTEDQIYLKLAAYLNELNPDVEVEIGGNASGSEVELIFTTHGDARYFQSVDDLVAHAPKLKGLRVYALKPPLLETFRLTYEGESLSSTQIWLKPAGVAPDTQALQFSVGISHSDNPEITEKRRAASLIAVESYLGERAYASLISVVAFVDLPADPAGCGFHSLPDIAHQLQLTRVQ